MAIVCLILPRSKGNVHVTWRDPDPENAWDSVGRDFGQQNKRYSYMGKYTLFTSFLKITGEAKADAEKLLSVGYSVLEEKKLLSRDEYTVVTGSPRDLSKGSVTLGSQIDKIIKTAFVINGEQVGSFFGGSLAATDLNNDE